MRKVTWGIIGLGNIANKFAQTLNAMCEVELIGVASRNKSKSEAFGEIYGVNLNNGSNENAFPANKPKNLKVGLMREG